MNQITMKMRGILLIFVLFFVGLVRAQDVSSEPVLYYILDEDNNTATLTEPDDGSMYSGDIIVPQKISYNGVVYTVTSIDDNAFYKCTELTSVSIPESVTSIANYAFRYCSSLTSISVNEANETFKSVDGVLFSKDGTQLYAYPSAKGEVYEVPSGTTETIEGAFASTAIKKVIFPDGFKVIEEATFNKCENLETAFLPSTVTNIYLNAFDGCTNISSLICQATTPPMLDGNYVFDNCHNLKAYVPSGSESEYAGWGSYDDVTVGIYAIPEDIINSDEKRVTISTSDEWGYIRALDYFSSEGYKIEIKDDIQLSSVDTKVDVGANVTIDGKGHNITLENPSVALFESIAKSATVKNIVVVSNNASTDGISGSYAAVFAVQNAGEIESCAVELSCAVNVSAGYFGSLVGNNSGTINNCYAVLNGSISGATNMGGLVGHMSGGGLTNGYVYANSVIDNVKATVGKTGTNVNFNNLYYYFEYFEGAEVNDAFGSEMSNEGDNSYSSSTFIAKFSNTMKWKVSGVTEAWQGTPRLTFSEADGNASIDENTNEIVVDVVLSDKESVEDFAEALQNNSDLYTTAIVTLNKDLEFDADVISDMQRIGTTDVPFNGTFDGGGYSITNMAVNADTEGSGALFGELGEKAEVKNVHIADAEISVNEVKDTYIEDDTVYIGVFADKLKGTLSNVSFVGSVKVEESIMSDDKVVKVCFYSDAEETGVIDHAFIYLTGEEEQQSSSEGNKVCIVIKQHIGAGRRSGRTRKTCSNRKTQKALVLNPDKDLDDKAQAEINSEYREFTDEEFARGDVAHWLNYTQKGYTGEYSGEWTQGELYPILDLEMKNPLVKIVYVIDGEEMVDFQAPSYGNVGTDLKMSYSEKPDEIFVNGSKMLASQIGLMETTMSIPTPTKDSDGMTVVKVELKYNKVATGIREEMMNEPCVTSDGTVVRVSNASGERVRIVTVRGIEIYEGEATSEEMSVMLPQSGIYIVTVGDVSKKVICR